MSALRNNFTSTLLIFDSLFITNMLVMDGTTFCYKLTFQKVGALKGSCLGIEVDFTGYPIQPNHKDKFDLN